MSNSPRFPWERDEEVLKIETPEQTEIHLVIADLGSRFAALFVDLLLITVFTIILALVVQATGLVPEEEGSGSILWIITSFLLLLFYFIFYDAAWDGQTPGKKMASTRVIQASGRGVQLSSSILRNIVRMVELSLFPLMLVPFFTRGRRTIGDLLAGTYVIRVIKETPPKGVGGLLRPANPDDGPQVFTFTESQKSMMYEDDLDLLTYLEENLAGKRNYERKKAMRSVVERYILRFSMEARREEAQREPERFLRELGLELRKKYEDRAF